MLIIPVSEWELQFMSANDQSAISLAFFMSKVDKRTLHGKLCAVWRSSVFFPSLPNNLFCSASCIH